MKHPVGCNIYIILNKSTIQIHFESIAIMKNSIPLVGLVAVFHHTAVVAFTPPKYLFSSSTACAATRRDFLSIGVSTTAAITSGLVINPLPSLADVSDGNALPQGAAQFSRIIKVRAQLKVW